jgi:GNAT superfamily N-acetyltransferase
VQNFCHFFVVLYFGCSQPEKLMEKQVVNTTGLRFSIKRDEKEVGRAYLYLLKNDLHTQPFGLLEDVFVEPDYRGTGVANELLEAVMAEAKRSCYKLIATSRDNGTRTSVHEWYIRLGFVDYGTEFRMNF